MLKALLTRDPNERPSAETILKMPWILKIKEQDESNQGLITNSVVANLKGFAVMNKLKKASLNVIATQLTDQAIKELKELFMAMDENNDGTLSVGELKEALSRASVAIPQDLSAMMEMIDTDGSGVIDYSEFMAATMDKRKYISEDVCWRAFKAFDIDGSGTIDKHELIRLLGLDTVNDVVQVNPSEDEVDVIMKEVDLNGDGKIDFDEFMTMMKKIDKEKSAGRIGGLR